MTGVPIIYNVLDLSADSTCFFVKLAVERFVNESTTQRAFCVANDGTVDALIGPVVKEDDYVFLVRVDAASWIVKWQFPPNTMWTAKSLPSKNEAIETVVKLLSDFVE